MREHGGNIDAAMARYGGTEWIDLSTGINRVPYPVPPLDPDVWTALPTQARFARAEAAARVAYGAPEAPCAVLAGAQAAIQLLPNVLEQGRVSILAPTYNEHAAAFAAADWAVREVASAEDLAGDVAVVVNPNNPTGHLLSHVDLQQISDRVGTLIVDESFADPTPGTSLLGQEVPPNTVVLRSFGKFFGLAGVRLGFAFGPDAVIQALQARAGPWAVSGPALALGALALADADWQRKTRQRLQAEHDRLDSLVQGAGWRLIGGTALFATYETGNGLAAQAHLAGHQFWSRVFAAQPGWLRLGLPGGPTEWARLRTALKAAASHPAVAPAR